MKSKTWSRGMKGAYLGAYVSGMAIKVFGVATGILTARLLGPAGRGDLATVFFLGSFAAAIGSFALPQATSYLISKDPHREADVACAGFWLAVVLGVIQIALYWFLVPLLIPGGRAALIGLARWFLLYILAGQVGPTLLGVDQGARRFSQFNLFQTLPPGAYLAGLCVAWLSGFATLRFFVLWNLAANFLVPLCRGIALSRRLFPRLLAARVLREIFKQGWSFHLPTLAGLALWRTDMGIMVRYATAEQIGYYAVALAVAMGQSGMSSPFTQIGFAAIAGEKEPERAKSLLARQFRFAQIVLVCTSLILGGSAFWLIPTVFGKDFAGAITAAYFLVAATAVGGVAQVLEYGLRAMGQPRPGVFSNLAALVLLCALGPLLLGSYGATGMAIAVLAGQVVNLVCLTVYTTTRLALPASLLWGFSPAGLFDFVSLARETVLRIGRSVTSAVWKETGE